MSTSKLRPELVGVSTSTPMLPYETALFLIKDSVARRRSLIYGRLHDGNGNSCAIGSFYEDNPGAIISWKLIEEVAAVNDSLGPKATAHARWKKVNSWLRWRIATLAGKQMPLP